MFANARNCMLSESCVYLRVGRKVKASIISGKKDRIKSNNYVLGERKRERFLKLRYKFRYKILGYKQKTHQFLRNSNKRNL